MRIREWFGWETLLAFSMFGGALRVLPVPGIYVWSGVLTAFVIAMSWLLLSAVKNGFEISSRVAIFSVGFTTLLLWCIITLLWSPISTSQLVTGDFYIIFIVVIPTLALAISTTAKPVLERRWVVGVVLAIFIISSYCLFLWITSPGSLYATLSENAIENVALGGVYLAVGQALMAFSIVSFIWGIFSPVWRKTAFAISAAVFWLAMGSGARGPVTWGILTVMVFLIIRFYQRKSSLKKKLITIFSVVIISAIILLAYLNFDFLASHSPFFNRFSSDSDRGYDELSSIGMRLNYWDRALSLFFDKPLFGQGALSFRSLSEFDSIYPHNLFLDALGDLGLVGFFLSVSLVSLGLVACWNIMVAGDRIMQKICAALFLYFLGMEMSSGYLYWSWVWPWAVVVIQVQSQTHQGRSRQAVLPINSSR